MTWHYSAYRQGVVQQVPCLTLMDYAFRLNLARQSILIFLL